LFFSLVNLARKLDVDSETALARGTRKFIKRFRAMEAEIVMGGRQVEQASAEELNAVWDRHKEAARLES
jgi:uncharacterized protein YabN with tetrapyrrole methylase and pyrophosphatase domain